MIKFAAIFYDNNSIDKFKKKNYFNLNTLKEEHKSVLSKPYRSDSESNR